MKIFEIDIFGIHLAPSYYGLMYALGFVICYYIIKARKTFSEAELDDLLLYVFLGVILGGRLGYMIFYDLGYYIDFPSEAIKIWKGGMSFHGGAIGVIIASILFSRKHKIGLYKITDNITSVLPIPIFLGRIGNYLNKELLGDRYTGILAVYKDSASYFPTPLLEAFLEGIVLYFILSYIFKNVRKPGITSGSFLLFYSIFRFIAEFYRTPDPQLGYLIGFLTMGQILSIPMTIAGIYFIMINLKNDKKA